MSRSPERDAQKVATTKRKLLQAAFRLFADRTIEAVTMTEVAEAAGYSVATVYRYYKSKPVLVVETATRVWEQYLKENDRRFSAENRTAAQEYERYLEAFLDLYRNYRDLLRFNQFFNAYVLTADVSPEQMTPYMDLIRDLKQRFSKTYEKGKADGTLRTDVPEQEIFSATMHLMLAAVTRYAAGLVYVEGSDPAQELELMKALMMRHYTNIPDSNR